MNLENVAKLVTALRSEVYAQTTNVLRDEDDKFCCLGVACDISGLGTWEKGKTLSRTASVWKYVVRDEDGEVIGSDHSVLPTPVAQWLGIEPTGEFVLPIKHINMGIRWGSGEDDYPSTPDTSLTELNDHALTFSQIADILENAKAFAWVPAPVDTVDEDEDDEDENDEDLNVLSDE